VAVVVVRRRVRCRTLTYVVAWRIICVAVPGTRRSLVLSRFMTIYREGTCLIGGGDTVDRKLGCFTRSTLPLDSVWRLGDCRTRFFLIFFRIIIRVGNMTV